MSLILSDNATGADNQQERLINIGWVIGFVDGEGCFSVGFVKQSDKVNRKGYKTGYQVSHEFAVTQGAKSIASLEKLQRFFGVGHITKNHRYDNHKEHMFRYTVRKRGDLLNIIIPFFESYQLQTAKIQDFVKFTMCVKLIEMNQHLNREGLIEIAEIVQTMNRKKSRADLIRILRDYTPDAHTPVSEDIVRSL